MNLALSGIEDTVKSEAVGFAIKSLTGEWPIVNNYSDYTEISFTPSQVDTLHALINRWSSSQPGSFRINAGQVLTPYVVKKYGMYAIGALLGVYLIGKLF